VSTQMTSQSTPCGSKNVPLHCITMSAPSKKSKSKVKVGSGTCTLSNGPSFMTRSAIFAVFLAVACTAVYVFAPSAMHQVSKHFSFSAVSTGLPKGPATQTTANKEELGVLAPKTDPGVVKSKVHADRSSGIPSYDEFVANSIAHKWEPSDPVKKLESTITRYKQVSLVGSE
jgi:hypothetical protein